MAKDRFQGHGLTLNSSLTSVEPVAPSDTMDLKRVSRASIVRSTGDVVVTMNDGGSGALYLIAGIVRSARVLSAGALAANVVAMSG